MSAAGPAWPPLLHELAQQRAFLDMFTAAWCAEYRGTGGTVHCGRGCSGCCSLAVSCTLTEAVAIAPALDERQAAAVSGHALRLRDRAAGIEELKEYLRLHRREMGACPLLAADGACGVYPLRPLSCRALISTKESSWCSVDFTELSSETKRAFLESLDQSAVAFPLHYAASPRETGGELEERCLGLMGESFGFSLYGSLPVLLHLVREHGLGDAGGYDEVQAVLRSGGFGNPLLTDLRTARRGGE